MVVWYTYSHAADPGFIVNYLECAMIFLGKQVSARELKEGHLSMYSKPYGLWIVMASPILAGHIVLDQAYFGETLSETL